MAENNKDDKSHEQVQLVTITGPIDINIKAPNDAMLAGVNEDGFPENVLVSGGGLVLENLLTGKDAASNKRVLLVEDDRTLRTQLIAWEGTTPGPIRVLAETTGELKVSVHGKDESLNIDAFRTSSDRMLRVYPYLNYYGQQTYTALLPAAEGILYNPATGASVILEVYFQLVNVNPGAAAVTGVYVGNDAGGGGALTAAEYWMFNETIPYPGNSGWRGPFLMNGTDDIRGVAAVANAVAIKINARRVDALA